MQRLILMRHAQARAAGPGGEDIDRRLTPTGQADARLMGRLLNDQNLIPDQALISAAVRAQETWAAVSEGFPSVRLQVRLSLYLASAGQMRTAAELAAVEDETLMIVAHNPGLHDLGVRLLRDGGAPPSALARMAGGFPPASIAAFTVDAAGRCAYDGLFFARDHGGGGME